MCIYSPMPHTLSYCALIGKCALIRSNTVIGYLSILKLMGTFSGEATLPFSFFASLFSGRQLLEERICSHRSTFFHVIVESILEGSSIQESKQEVAL